MNDFVTKTYYAKTIKMREDFHQRNGVYLTAKPELKELKSRFFYTFDVETKDGLLRKELFCWSLCVKRNNEYKVLTSTNDLTELFDEFNKRSFDKKRKNKSLNKESSDNHILTIYVHNLAFECGFLVDYMSRNNVDHKVLQSSSRVIAIVLPQFKIRFVDTLQFLFCEQDKAEKIYEVDEQYRKIDCKDLFEKSFSLWTKEDKERVIAHNKNDVIALHQIMSKFRLESYNIAKIDCLTDISLSSFALHAFRTTIKEQIPNPFIYIKKNNKTDKITYDYEKEEEAFVRKSYYGGRNEVFDLNIDENCSYADTISMYAKQMTKKLPIGFGRWSKNKIELMKAIKSENEIEGFILCKIQPIENSLYPILPERLLGKTLFTFCYRENVYALPELRYAYESGYKIEPLIGFVFDESYAIFNEFVEKFFALKQISKGAKREIAKHILTNCYGKTGQAFLRKSAQMYYFTSLDQQTQFIENTNKNIVKNVKSKDNNLYISIESIESIIIKSYMNVCWSSYITSYARIHLCRKLHECEKLKIHVKYCDTDSITLKNLDLTKLTIGKNLGDWDIEKTFGKVKFLAPKCYIAENVKERDKNKVIPIEIKMKGIEHRKIKEFESKYKTIEELEPELRKEIILAERYMCHVEAHRYGVVLKTKTPKKHYSFDNKKRIFNRNGYSIAYNNDTIHLLTDKKEKSVKLTNQIAKTKKQQQALYNRVLRYLKCDNLISIDTFKLSDYIDYKLTDTQNIAKILSIVKAI